MGDVESGRQKLGNNNGSLVTVSVQDDVSVNDRFDLGMRLGVTFDMEGVEGGCPSNLNEADDEESLLEIPELSKSCCGLQPRTIPFRSASFSQVDITSDGKYIRNPRSAITLKPTAFCLLNNSNTNNFSQKGSSHNNYGYSASTIPRHGDKSSTFPSNNPSTKSQSVVASQTNLSQSIISQLNKENQKREFEHHQQPQQIEQIQQDQEQNVQEKSNTTDNSKVIFQENQTESEFLENVPKNDDENANEISPMLICPAETNENEIISSVNMQCFNENSSNNPDNNNDSNNDNNNDYGQTGFDNLEVPAQSPSGFVQFYLGPEPDDSKDVDCVMDIIDPGLLQKEEEDDGVFVNKLQSLPSLDCDLNPLPSCEGEGNTNEINSLNNFSEPLLEINNCNDGNTIMSADTNMLNTVMSPNESENALVGTNEHEHEHDTDNNKADTFTADNIQIISSRVEMISDPPENMEKVRDLKLEADLVNLENIILGNFPELEITSSIGFGQIDDDKNPLLRQSSGQSDGSDEIPPLTLISSSANSSNDLQCSSPPSEKSVSGIVSGSHGHGHGTIRHPLSIFHSRGQSESTIIGLSTPGISTTNYDVSGSASTSASGNNNSGNNNNSSVVNKKEISRANSVSCSGTGVDASGGRPLPPRRYNKRPLRGPYGLMLEAEMKNSALKNELIPARSLRDYDNSDFCRESKSSSPNRTVPSLHSSLSHVDPEPRSAVLGSSSDNCSVWASMDDLHFTTSQSKAINPRSRKIGSSQLPAQNAHFPGETAPPLAFHQRTASSPSQLLYSSNDRPVQGRNSKILDVSSPRGHVLAEVLETERSYVESLTILVQKYMEPLKNVDYVDASVVDEIFYQIPSILWHHESILEALQTCIENTQCVGGLLVETFKVNNECPAENSLLKCYSAFVSNWKNAKAQLKIAATNPRFQKFIEENARQHRGKLTIDALLIMPIQRIPRYELLLKELLKHTSPNHEDFNGLRMVVENIKQFALHIDCASVDHANDSPIEFEGWTGPGLGHIVRHDIVTICSNSNVKKERALFLLNDCIIIASVKRKSTMRKPSSSTFHSLGNSFEGCKFKLIRTIPIMDIHLLNEDHDVGGGNSSSVSSPSMSSSISSSSVTTVSRATPKSGADDGTDDLKIIHKMMELASQLKCSHTGLEDMLKELASFLKHHYDNGEAIDVEIKPNDNSGSESSSPDFMKILFCSVERKISWLECFQETLNKFSFGKEPQWQFLQALPIRKTRAGLQLSCAAPVSLHNKVSSSSYTDLWIANSDGYVGQICILTLQPEPAITSCNGVCNSRITCIISVPPPSPPQSQPLHPALAPHYHTQEDQHPHPHVHSLGYESEDDSHRNRAGHKNAEGGKYWTVWLGTEDGGLHIYDCSDSVRVKKNRHKLQHSAPLNSMVYYNSRVFVSFGNGDVAVYIRNASKSKFKHYNVVFTGGKGWSVGDPSWITIGSAVHPVTKMICVRSQIWFACGPMIKVYGENGGMLELKHSFQVTMEGSHLPREVSCIAASDEHVWVAIQGTSFLKCYSSATFECTYETNVAADVTKILAGCDDIIRQHKSACMRVTALLVAPDKTLWVGTSAGVILTVNFVANNYKITPLCHGHTGQVRFMTTCTDRNGFTVISGGDGYEEFRPLPPLFTHNNSTSSSFGSMINSFIGESSVDVSGREDSTNHLLIWKIQKSAGI